MITGIYKIQSITKPDRIYIGSSLNIQKRWREHKWNLLKNKHHSIKLQRHVNKYGIGDLIFSVIELCTAEVLQNREQIHIDNYSLYFNTSVSSFSPMLNRHHSEISKLKIGKANSQKTTWSKGKHLTKEHRDKIGIGNRGKIVSDESKQKMRVAALGRKLSEEHRKKISNALKGRHISEEQKQMISISRKNSIGYKFTEEHKKHIREKILMYWASKKGIRKVA